MKMSGLWWWIDRWRKSTAYSDMTLEQQGAYRNLLDEATLRGGPLPNDERVLAKACGDALAWKRVRSAVMSRFTLDIDGWHNETLDAVLKESSRRREKQQKWRQSKSSKALVGGNGTSPQDGNEASNNSSNVNGNGTVTTPVTDSVLRSSSPILITKPERTISCVEVDDALSDRARGFIERYPSIFAKCRNGATYRVKESRDFTTCVDIVSRESEDARLDSLLEYFLRVKDKSFLNTPGSPGQFLYMLPECDRVLREHGR